MIYLYITYELFDKIIIQIYLKILFYIRTIWNIGISILTDYLFFLFYFLRIYEINIIFILKSNCLKNQYKIDTLIY